MSNIENNLIEINDLCVDFIVDGARHQGLKKIDLNIPRNTIVGLVGESGSGKSTLISCLTGLMDSNAQIASGVYSFDGKEMLSKSDAEMRELLGRDITMVFQDPMSTLNPLVTVEKQMIDIQYRLTGTTEEKRARAIAALNRVGIPEPERRLAMYPFEFSGGQCQRISIAMATMLSPKLLLADEPTTALDATLQVQILGLLKKMQKDLGCSMLFVSHHLGLVAALCDYVGVMRYGEILEFGQVRDVFKNPQHSYTRQLLACDPAIIKGKVKRFPTMENSSGATVTIPQGTFLEKRIQKMDDANRNEDKILKVQDVKIRFGEQTLLSRFNKTDPYFYAVKGVTFSVNQGETVALVGESGSGKTTVAQGIMGLVDTCGGEINCMGQPLSTMSKSQLAAMRREAVMIFQDPMGSLNPRMSVRNIVLEPYDIQGIRIKNREREANRLLTMVGLGPNFAERYPHQLSGGQARRVGVARALMLGPKLIVADEPTSGLDVSVQGEVLNLFLELKEKLGIALLIITHNLNIVRHVADRVLIMYMGEILEQGRTDEVFANPRHEYTKQLLAANSYAIETL